MQDISYTIDEENIAHLNPYPDKMHVELNGDKMHHGKTKLKKPKRSIDCEEKVKCSAKESAESKYRYSCDKRQFFNKRICIALQCDITYLFFLAQWVYKYKTCVALGRLKCMF